MRARRFTTTFSILLCAAATVGVVGCGEEVDEAILIEEAGGCAAAQAAGGWVNQTFPEQAASFDIALEVTPSGNGIDAVVGVSSGPATSFSRLAAIVRFNTAGTIDVRSGSTYRADVAVAYSAGATYQVELTINVIAHTYNVAVGTPSGQWYFIASNYPFRTEQAAVARLDNVGAFVDSPTGSLQLCGLVMMVSSPGGQDCVTPVAGGGWTSTQQAAANKVMTTELWASPTRANTDAVIGLTNGPADAFTDLAAAVRFAPDGTLDVRRGGAYVRDAVYPYQPGRWYAIRFVVDLTAHRYSVVVAGSGGTIEIARGYEFRTEQSAVAQLDHVASIVDTTAGALQVCGVRTRVSTDLAYIREGQHVAAAMPGNQVVVADETTLYTLGASGAPVNAAPTTGAIAYDGALSRVYVARAAGGVLTVESRRTDLTSIWTNTYAVDNGLTASAIATDGGGLVYVVLSDHRPRVLVSLAPEGGVRWTMPVTADAIGFTPTGAVIARSGTTFVVIDQLDAGGLPVWERVFDAPANVAHVAGDAAGRIVFAGTYGADANFGGATLPWEPPHPDEWVNYNTYAVGLTAAGDHAFSRRVGFETLTGLSATPTRIAIAGEIMTQLRYANLQILDGAGNVIREAYESMLGFQGASYGVAVGESRIYWSTAPQWPITRELWPYLVAIDR
jgi:hypothetical protein